MICEICKTDFYYGSWDEPPEACECGLEYQKEYLPQFFGYIHEYGVYGIKIYFKDFWRERKAILVMYKWKFINIYRFFTWKRYCFRCWIADLKEKSCQ